jgi:hypothetical protein
MQEDTSGTFYTRSPCMSVYQMRVSAVCVLVLVGMARQLRSSLSPARCNTNIRSSSSVYSGAVCLMARKILLCWLNLRLLLLFWAKDPFWIIISTDTFSAQLFSSGKKESDGEESRLFYCSKCPSFCNSSFCHTSGSVHLIAQFAINSLGSLQLC